MATKGFALGFETEERSKPNFGAIRIDERFA